MQASNIQSKQEHRQPLYYEPYEAKYAIEGCMQEAPALWIKANTPEAHAKSKDASQACVERDQKADRRRQIEEDLFFLQFCQKYYFHLFSPF